MDDDLSTVVDSFSVDSRPTKRYTKKPSYRVDDEDDDDFDAIDDEAEYRTPSAEEEDEEEEEEDVGYGLVDGYATDESNEVVRRRKKAPPPKKSGKGSPSLLRAKSSSEDEDLVPGEDEGSKMQPIEKRAVAGKVFLARLPDRKRTAHDASIIITHGKSRTVPSLKSAHINEVVAKTTPKDLAYIKLGEDYIHALSLVDPTGNHVTYYELNVTEEQKIVRGILLSVGGLKKPDYDALEREQIRWDTKLDDMDTASAEIAGRFKSCFPVHLVKATKRRRAFILSTNFIEKRAKRRAERGAASTKKSAAVVDSDDDATPPPRKAVKKVVRSAPPAPSGPMLKVTEGRHVAPGASVEKPRFDPKSASLVRAINKRAAGAPSAPSNPFEFAARNGAESKGSPKKKAEATPDRPIRRRTGPGHPPNAPKRARVDEEDDDKAYCIIVKRLTPKTLQRVVDMLCE